LREQLRVCEQRTFDARQCLNVQAHARNFNSFLEALQAGFYPTPTPMPHFPCTGSFS
jgi:hypothetical protein